MSTGQPTRLTDREEVLRRQVHPNHIKADGSISTVAFTPNANDQGLLSTLRESVSPQEAHRRHTEDRDLKSAGTWGVSVGEIDDVEVESNEADEDPHRLQALDDAAAMDVPDHASIDFTALPTPGKVKQGARKLLKAATRLHP